MDGKRMKVKELIENLCRFDPEQPVVIHALNYDDRSMGPLLAVESVQPAFGETEHTIPTVIARTPRPETLPSILDLVSGVEDS